MRTIGNGCIGIGGGRVTGIAPATTPGRPLACETRSRTTCGPGEMKDVVRTGPPPAKAPVPARSQANAVIGLAGSVEFEASDTGSPVWGVGGNHVNEAAGGTGKAVVSVAAALVAEPAV